MVHAANTDLFNPLVPKAHNSGSKSAILLHSKPLKVSQRKLADFYFFH